MPYTDDEEKQYRELLGRVGGGGTATSTSETPTDKAPTARDQFAQGYKQGWLNLVEGPAHWAEQGIRHIPGLSEFKMPLHDWAANYRREAESSLPGIAGEVAGTASPFFIPGGAIAEAIRGPALASDLARIASVAARIPGATRAASLAGRAGGAAERLADAGIRGGQAVASKLPQAVSSRLPALENARWSNLTPAQRAFIKGGIGAAAFSPKSSEHFGQEAMEDFMLGGILGRFGDIGERVSPGGKAISELYASNEIPAIWRRKPPGPGEYWRPPRTREPTEKTVDSRIEGALKAARQMREHLENPDRVPRGGWYRNYPEEMRLSAEAGGRDAARQLEREQSAYQRRRNLPRDVGHFAWHLPFLFGHQLGLPLSMRYLGAATLSWLARQWGRQAARGRLGQAPREVDRLPPHRAYRRWLDRASPYGLGAAGGTAYQEIPGDDSED